MEDYTKSSNEEFSQFNEKKEIFFKRPEITEPIAELFLKKLQDELTPDEEIKLELFLRENPHLREILNEEALSNKVGAMLELDKKQSWDRIDKALSKEWKQPSAAKKIFTILFAPFRRLLRKRGK